MPMRPLLRENAATVTVAAASSILFTGRLVMAMLSPETKLMAVCWAVLGFQYFLYVFQRYLSRWSRRSGHLSVRYAAYVPTLLAFYAANVMYTSTPNNINESTRGHIWRFALVLICMTRFFSSPAGACLSGRYSYYLRDDPRHRWVLFLAGQIWPWLSVSRAYRVPLADRITPYAFGLAALSTLFARPPESIMDCQTQAVADYMNRESESKSSPFFDHDGGCMNPFMQREEDGQWITIKYLMQQLHDDDDLRDVDQDVWLSYSLSRLLARRYHGFRCAEQGDEKVLGFALAQLGGPDGFRRAFTIVEVQLAFLHDYFFTNSLQDVEFRSRPKRHNKMLHLDFLHDYFFTASPPKPYNMLQLELFMMFFAIELWLLGYIDPAMGWLQKSTDGSDASANLIITLLVSMVIIPARSRLPKYWHPILMASRKVNGCATTTIPEWLWLHYIRAVSFCPHYLRAAWFFLRRTNEQQDDFNYYWSNTMGQYSILHDYDRPRSLKKAAVALFKGHVLSQPSYSFIKHLSVEEEEVRVPDSVRKLVADTLCDIRGPPTNGTRSLQMNRAMAGYGYDWSWTCREETHTDTILIWHIATCYCSMSPPYSFRPEGFPWLLETDTQYEVATKLSRYCAYLVAFLPQFLPEHSLTTKVVFQRVLQDAQRALATTSIRELQLPCRRNQTTFHKGVKLGRQLETLDPRHRWKVMAEFWAETILYVAPSDNAEAHIQHLAQGGEFVTHLWALLSNAGILKQAL